MTFPRRTHDRVVYLAESRYETPKAVHQAVVDLAEKSGALAPGALVVDIGCANGEFLYYLARRIPGPVYRGYDVVPELVEKARRSAPGITFSIGTVLDATLLEPQSGDVLFLLGTHSIFDDLVWLDHLVRWTRRGGRIYVEGLFNPHPIDVWVKYRRADDTNDHREPGWNIVSRETVGRRLAALGATSHSFVPFEMPLDLPARPDDPVRSWTARLDGRRVLVNGLSLIVNVEILEIVV